MKVKLILVPFDSSHFNMRMGAGPFHVRENGIVKALESAGHEVSCQEIEEPEKFPTENATTFKILGWLKGEVFSALQHQYLPIILSGNCSATVGVMAGHNSTTTGVIWFDAHGDCETPETTTSGFLDGMAISMLLNRSWQNLLARHQLHSPLTGKNIALIGARDLSNHEEQFIKTTGINHITVDEIKHFNTDAIKSICSEFVRSGMQKIHVHVDVDVIDPLVAPSNSYAVGKGLSTKEVFNMIDACKRVIPIASATISSYDPSLDGNNKMLQVINTLVQNIVNP
jgi:arginase